MTELPPGTPEGDGAGPNFSDLLIHRTWGNSASCLVGSVAGALIVNYSSYWLSEPLSHYVNLPDWVRLAIVLCVITFSGAACRYWSLIGQRGAPADSSDGVQFQLLVDSLAHNRTMGGLYSEQVNRFLYLLDWVFNDRGQLYLAGTVRKRFGLNKGGLLWTARAFDRSLLFAFTYPIMTILLVWAFRNEVDPLGQALGFTKVAQDWRRQVALATIFILAILMWLTYRMSDAIEGWLEPRLGNRVARVGAAGAAVAVWAVCAVGAGFAGVASVAGGAGVAGGAMTAVVAVGAVIAVIVAGGVGAGAAAVAVIAACAAVAVIAAVAVGEGVITFVAAVAVIAVSAGIVIAINSADARGKLGWALAIGWLILFASCLTAPELSTSPVLGGHYAVLLMLGLFTLINAPFDWFALGLTRWFLRKGLEAGRDQPWAPLGYAICDIGASLLLMALLALALVTGAMLLEAVSGQAGVTPYPDLRTELTDLSDPARRWAPEHFWVYVTLWTTQLFSVINVMIGSWSLLRGSPWINARVHRALTAPARISGVDRVRYAAILGAQVTLACIGALAVYAILVLLVFGHYGLFGDWLLRLIHTVFGI